MIEKARLNGYWFRSKGAGEWLTPEEFEALCKANRIAYGENNRSIIDGYRMHDPRNEITGRMAEAAKITTDLQAFSERVFAYFNQVPKDKK